LSETIRSATQPQQIVDGARAYSLVSGSSPSFARLSDRGHSASPVGVPLFVTL